MKLFSLSIMLAFLMTNLTCCVGCPFYYNPEHIRSNEFGAIAGTVYNNGRPIMGQIQLIDPKTETGITTNAVNNSGHFIFQDIPAGEYFLAFLGPASNPIGNFKYVKVMTGRPLTDVVFEITEKDPKVVELIKKIESEKTETDSN